MKLSSLLLGGAVALFTLSAYAVDLATARTQGLVGETLTGYVTALQNSPEVQALADSVNARRKEEYARISKENGQPVDTVARLAFSQIVSGLPAGASYQNADGSWAKK